MPIPKSHYQISARRSDAAVELHIELLNLKGEWVEVFKSPDPEEVRRYLRTRTDPGAEIIWNTP
jgi:hypothetical protein